MELQNGRKETVEKEKKENATSKIKEGKTKKRNNEKKERIKRKKRKSYSKLDVEGEENEMEIRRNSKKRGEKEDKSMAGL